MSAATPPLRRHRPSTPTPSSAACRAGTTSASTETELLIQDAVARLLAGRTALVVAHRLSTIEHADRILVMHAGEIRESGTHAALLQQRGLYYRLYQLQYAHGAAGSPPLQPAAAS